MTLRTKVTPLTEYERGCIDERERILALIRDSMLEWGHHGAIDCVSCTTARMLSKVITGRSEYD